MKVEEPSVEDAIKILHGLKGKYEAHHKARYEVKALEHLLASKRALADLVDGERVGADHD